MAPNITLLLPALIYIKGNILRRAVKLCWVNLYIFLILFTGPRALLWHPASQPGSLQPVQRWGGLGCATPVPSGRLCVRPPGWPSTRGEQELGETSPLARVRSETEQRSKSLQCCGAKIIFFLVPAPAPFFPLFWLRLQLYSSPVLLHKKWEIFGFNQIKTVLQK